MVGSVCPATLEAIIGQINVRPASAPVRPRGEEMTAKALLKRLRRNSCGQGMTEYIIIVALIAITAIGVVTIFGDNVRDLFAGAITALAGEQKVKVGTEKARASHTKSTNLKDFAEDNKGSMK
jgi:pilus assembly protein Flp/PilA